MKIIGVLITVFFICSCAESEYNKRSWEIATKKMELEYLNELMKVRSNTEKEIFISNLDSLIQDQTLKLQEL